MNRSFPTRLIGVTFWLAPVLMLVSDLLGWLAPSPFFWVASLAFWLSFYTFLGLIYGMFQLSNRSTYAVVSFLVAVFGALIGITIIGMTRYAWGVGVEGVAPATIQAAHANPWVLFTSRVPGITFPIGLIMLSIALKRNHRINGLLLTGLIFSILLFPLGRIPQWIISNVIGDALMIVFFGMVGRIYRNKEAVPTPVERRPVAVAEAG
jgi:hypothetical protein